MGNMRFGIISQHPGMNLRQKYLSPEQLLLKTNFSPRNFPFLVMLIFEHSSVTTRFYFHWEIHFSTAFCGQVIFYHLFPPSQIPFISLRGVPESLHDKQKRCLLLGVCFSMSALQKVAVCPETGALVSREIQNLWETVSQGVALKEVTREWNSYPAHFPLTSFGRGCNKIKEPWEQDLRSQQRKDFSW